MQPTKEQQKVVDFVTNSDKNLKINAYAGSGKTSTLVQVAKTNPDKSFLYLAFNKAIKTEAESKFPSNCQVYTLHGLAYNLLARDYFGPTLNSRLTNRWKNQDYVKFFGAQRSRMNSQSFMMYAARRMVTRFKQSGDFTIDEHHVDPEHEDKLRHSGMREAVALAKKVWNEEVRIGSNIPIDHDTYLKCFQMSRPDINLCDVILLDEAQDINPVMESILDDLKTRVILVGDSYQAIYQWRGAFNAMEKLEGFESLWLTKSFRFGDSIANLASRILKMLDKDTPKLEGNSSIPSKIGELKDVERYTTLFRTNAEMARTALKLIDEDFTVYVEGGVTELCDDLTDLYLLYKGEQKTHKSNKYRIFKNYEEVLEEAEHSVDIEKDVDLLNTLGKKLPEAVDKLKRVVKDKRSINTVDRILSTAHKSKGLEWDYVKLNDDFKFITKSRPEWNLIYVAITRAVLGVEFPDALYEGMAYFKKPTTEALI